MTQPKETNRRYDGGAAMLIAVVFFLFISMTIVLGIVTPILKQATVSKNIVHSKESYYLAEGVMEDALYRVKQGLNITSGETVVLNGYSTTITLTNTSTGKAIQTESNRSGVVRKMRAEVVLGVGVAFNYGIQTGNGGFSMNNNSFVIGNVYSNGDITGSSGTYITGSAIAANTAALAADQLNDAPTPIGSCTSSNCINFDNANLTEDVAQSFQVSTLSPINKVQLYIKKVAASGSPSNLTVRIVTDNNGVPSTNTLDSVTLNASNVTTSFGWVEAVFPNNPELTPGVTYWVVLDGTYNTARYYAVGANTSYASGGAKIGKYSGAWNNTNPVGLDMYFKIYLGGLTSVISNVRVGEMGVGNAHANTITNSVVHGSLYCLTGSGNKNENNQNINCDTSQAPPSPQGFPVSDANIEFWKEEAEAGGVHIGDYSVQNGASATLGPKKITGNLIVGNGSTLIVSGTLWVVGNITSSNNTIIRLSPSYGNFSGNIVADGRVSISNNADFQGSGQPSSYMMVLTTSDCPTSASCGGAYAIDVSNNAGTVIMNAQRGTIRFQNNAGAKEATAYRLFLDNNASIEYESGLADVNFSSGPSGGYSISSWKEVE